LAALSKMIPVATETLKFAKKEVARLSANLNSIFATFAVQGPQIFDSIAAGWRILWLIYFFLFAPMTAGLLYYGFWASGWFGGPKPLGEDEEYEPPTTCREKISACCSACCLCCTKFHDTQLCFWSGVIVMQIIVLIIFIVSIILCILAGVKAFMTSGCAQVYILGDGQVCVDTLMVVKNWLNAFYVADLDEALDQACPANNLLTCEMITEKMEQSTILTVIGSFLGALISSQLILESAVLHEHAKWRRMFNTKMVEENPERPDVLVNFKGKAVEEAVADGN